MMNDTFRRWVLSGVLVGVVGCGGDVVGVVGVADLDAYDTRLDLRLREPLLGASEYLEVSLRGFEKDQEEHGCLRLSEDVRLTLNGRPLKVLERGSVDLFGNCRSPSFKAELPSDTETVSTFVLSDGKAERVAEFLNIFVPLTLRVVSPEDGVLHPGQPVELELLPGTDDFGPLISMSLRDGAGQSRFFAFSQEGKRLSFEVPSETREGTGSIEFSGQHGITGSSRCDFGRCINYTQKSCSVAVEIAVP